MRPKFTLLAAAGSALVLAGCTKGGGEAASQPEANVGADKDWPTVGGSVDETSYSRLSLNLVAAVARRYHGALSFEDSHPGFTAVLEVPLLWEPPLSKPSEQHQEHEA